MNEHELGDAFARILPEQPSTKGWAGKVRRRRQRQRAAAGVAGLAVVAAVAIPLGLGLGNSSPQVLTTPAPDPSGTGTTEEQLIPDACGWPAVDATPLTAGELRADPERVWICGQDDDLGTARRTVGAPDPLQMGAVEAVRTFEKLPLDRGLADCAPNPLSFLYRLVVEYPDGTHSAVSADHCGFLRDVADDQDYFRAADAEFVDTLHGLWRQEREAAGLEFTGTDELCSTLSTSVWRPLDPSTLTRAVACDGENARPTELPADLAAELIASLESTGTAKPQEEPLIGGPPELVFLTPEGDPLSLTRRGDEGTGQDPLAWDEGSGVHVWAISPELQQRIDDHVAAIPVTEQTPPSVSPTLGAEDLGGLAPKVCADVQSGAVAPGFLGRTEDLPTGAEKVWLCGDLNDPFGGVLGPREPLLTDPDRVVEAINALESAPDGEVACTLIGGLTYHLAIDYPDGTRRVLAAETVNCSFVGGGRVGGKRLLEQIQPMWEQQRATVGSGGPENPVLCDTFPGPEDRTAGYTSFLPIDVSDAVQGAACGLSNDATGFDGEVLQRQLPVKLVKAIAGAGTGEEPLSNVEPGLPYLVLLNEFGDPMTVGLTVDGDLLLPQGRWTPDPDTAALLADTLAGIRTQPFYKEPEACSKYVEGEAQAALGDVVAGVACVQAFAVPEKGPELEPEFAQLLAERFEAESVLLSWGARSSHVTLEDSQGRHVNLYYDNRNHFDASLSPGLVNEAGDRVWELPDGVKAELELYGFDFTKQ